MQRKPLEITPFSFANDKRKHSFEILGNSETTWVVGPLEERMRHLAWISLGSYVLSKFLAFHSVSSALHREQGHEE